MNEKMNNAIKEYSCLATESNRIDPELYTKYEVKRGLRDISGKGVLAGLTEISEIISYIVEDNEMIPCRGKLRYRGINVKKLAKGFLEDERYGFEEICYLLLMGSLPNKREYDEFCSVLAQMRNLPDDFVHDHIMVSPSKDIMNMMARSVLCLYGYDDNPDSVQIDNVMRQVLELVAKFPLLAVYGYCAYNHTHKNGSLVIHAPQPELSTAENILYMLRPDSKYTESEARLLDLVLVLHAEHGGGNNSTFTNHVVTSSATDTYSAVAASLGSLKGPRHGGANIRVVRMFDEIKANVKDWNDDDEISAYLEKILNKEAFDRSGLIYGLGHAVYSISDPRAEVMKEFVEQLAEEKGFLDEYRLYANVERLAPQVIQNRRKIYKGVSANVDFYSGLVYRMLGLPEELYTPLFAVARIAGWGAHRIEELVNAGKIIRPAYKAVAQHEAYVEMKDRD